MCISFLPDVSLSEFLFTSLSTYLIVWHTAIKFGKMGIEKRLGSITNGVVKDSSLGARQKGQRPTAGVGFLARGCYPSTPARDMREHCDGEPQDGLSCRVWDGAPTAQRFSTISSTQDSSVGVKYIFN